MKPALLIIDVQVGIDESRHWGGNRNNPEAEGNIRLLLTEWRKKQWPVILVQHCSTSGESPFHSTSEGNKLKEFVSINPGETLIRKKTANAFLNTGLEETLRNLGAGSLVVTGFITNNSVESTARMAGELGFKTTVVSDATATFNKKGIDGTIYSSELIHQISLSNLSGEYAEIKSTKEVLTITHSY
jgi:nicotinamidase-related amidase